MERFFLISFQKEKNFIYHLKNLQRQLYDDIPNNFEMSCGSCFRPDSHNKKLPAGRQGVFIIHM